MMKRFISLGVMMWGSLHAMHVSRLHRPLDRAGAASVPLNQVIHITPQELQEFDLLGERDAFWSRELDCLFHTIAQDPYVFDEAWCRAIFIELSGTVGKLERYEGLLDLIAFSVELPDNSPEDLEAAYHKAVDLHAKKRKILLSLTQDVYRAMQKQISNHKGT